MMNGSKPTPFKWMGNTVQQEHVLRYIDRENPVGEIVCVQEFGSRGLTLTDTNGLEHTFLCERDGSVRRLGEEVCT